MTSKARIITIIGLLLLIALVIGACSTEPATDPETDYQTARAYEEGEGVPKNFTEAVHWYRKAAMQRHARAQCAVGFAYANGWGVPENFTEAYAWYILAKATGELTEEETETLEEDITDLRNELTSTQITQAQQRATELHEQIQANIAQKDQAN